MREREALFQGTRLFFPETGSSYYDVAILYAAMHVFHRSKMLRSVTMWPSDHCFIVIHLSLLTTDVFPQ